MIPAKGSSEWHRLQIARRTLRLPDAILGVLGGMSRKEAQEIVARYKDTRDKE